MSRRLTRFRGLAIKEGLQIVRDPSSIMIAFVLPIFLLLIFGYGISLDANDVKVAIVAENPGPETESLIQSFEASRQFTARRGNARQAAEKALLEGRLDGVVVLASDFARALDGEGGAAVQALVNGTDSGTARIVLGYIEGVWQAWLVQRGFERAERTPLVVRMESRVWYNPALLSRNFIVPGLIAIIMTLIGALLTSLVVAREWERGTMEALLATPVGLPEMLLGKLVPYFVLGMLSVAMVVIFSVGLFDVPYRGSIPVLVLSSSLFLLGALATGLLISAAMKSQFAAAELAIVATFLPSFILSGFIFDIRSMPEVMQWITYIVPARYFIDIMQTEFLVGNVWEAVAPNLLALSAYAAVMFVLTTLRLKKSVSG